MPRPSNTDERRQQIVFALLQVMADRGYERASVGEVAQAAGLSAGLVHYHFKDKQEILLALMEHLWSEAQRRMEARGGSSGIDGVLDALLGTGEDAQPAEVRCWVAIAAEALRQPEVGKAYAQILDSLAGRLERLIAAELREGTGSAQGARRMAGGILAAVQGYFVLSAASPSLVPPGSAASTVKQMVRGLVTARAR